VGKGREQVIYLRDSGKDPEYPESFLGGIGGGISSNISRYSPTSERNSLFKEDPTLVERKVYVKPEDCHMSCGPRQCSEAPRRDPP
jgi:hypothetical protein